jgi:hypothetical protein
MNNNLCEQIKRDIAELEHEFGEKENENFINYYNFEIHSVCSKLNFLRNEWQYILFNGKTDNIELLERLIQKFQDLKSDLRQMKEAYKRQVEKAYERQSKSFWFR